MGSWYDPRVERSDEADHSEDDLAALRELIAVGQRYKRRQLLLKNFASDRVEDDNLLRSRSRSHPTSVMTAASRESFHRRHLLGH